MTGIDPDRFPPPGAWRIMNDVYPTTVRASGLPRRRLYKDFAMPGIDETKEVRASSVDQSRVTDKVDFDLSRLESFVGNAFGDERISELLAGHLACP